MRQVVLAGALAPIVDQVNALQFGGLAADAGEE